MNTQSRPKWWWGKPPDISSLVLEIIKHLGLDPKDVRSLNIDATEPHVTVTLYLLNSEGHKYIDESGSPALTTKQIKARTSANKPDFFAETPA